MNLLKERKELSFNHQNLMTLLNIMREEGENEVILSRIHNNLSETISVIEKMREDVEEVIRRNYPSE